MAQDSRNRRSWGVRNGSTSKCLRQRVELDFIVIRLRFDTARMSCIHWDWDVGLLFATSPERLTMCQSPCGPGGAFS